MTYILLGVILVLVLIIWAQGNQMLREKEVTLNLRVKRLRAHVALDKIMPISIKLRINKISQEDAGKEIFDLTQEGMWGKDTPAVHTFQGDKFVQNEGDKLI